MHPHGFLGYFNLNCTNPQFYDPTRQVATPKSCNPAATTRGFSIDGFRQVAVFATFLLGGVGGYRTTIDTPHYETFFHSKHGILWGASAALDPALSADSTAYRYAETRYLRVYWRIRASVWIAGDPTSLSSRTRYIEISAPARASPSVLGPRSSRLAAADPPRAGIDSLYVDRGRICACLYCSADEWIEIGVSDTSLAWSFFLPPLAVLHPPFFFILTFCFVPISSQMPLPLPQSPLPTLHPDCLPFRRLRIFTSPVPLNYSTALPPSNGEFEPPTASAGNSLRRRLPSFRFRSNLTKTASGEQLQVPGVPRALFDEHLAAVASVRDPRAKYCKPQFSADFLKPTTCVFHDRSSGLRTLGGAVLTLYNHIYIPAQNDKSDSPPAVPGRFLRKHARDIMRTWPIVPAALQRSRAGASNTTRSRDFRTCGAAAYEHTAIPYVRSVLFSGRLEADIELFRFSLQMANSTYLYADSLVPTLSNIVRRYRIVPALRGILSSWSADSRPRTRCDTQPLTSVSFPSESVIRPILPPEMAINICPAADVAADPWRGMARFAQTEEFESVGITRADYDEHGGERVHKWWGSPGRRISLLRPPSRKSVDETTEHLWGIIMAHHHPSNLPLLGSLFSPGGTPMTSIEDVYYPPAGGGGIPWVGNPGVGVGGFCLVRVGLFRVNANFWPEGAKSMNPCGGRCGKIVFDPLAQSLVGTLPGGFKD
ncbi:hypothetical protein C8R43DRAFT_952225 [Mycena crocata]|nr:hypothetical protein C8R43DRAFT_952225 [Mycena crocata]